MLYTPVYDPKKTFEDNDSEGPKGDYADGKIFENQGQPQYEVFGQKVYLPFGTAASPLGLNSKYIKTTFEKGFDIVTYKTVRSIEYPPHNLPNILAVHPQGTYTLEQADQGILADDHYEEPISIANSFGIGSWSPDKWQKDMKDAIQSAKKGQFLIASYQGTLQKDGNISKYIEDFVKTAKLIKETGVKVIETNLSCPNEGTTDLLCFDTERSKTIIEKVKNEIGNTPYIIKLAYFRDKALLREFVKNVGFFVEGIAAINTISTKLIDSNGNQAFPGQGRLRSGVSGDAIKSYGLDMVKELKNLREEFNMSYQILGIGGVVNPEDYISYKNTGADIVMSATGAMWNPYLAQEIKHEVNL